MQAATGKGSSVIFHPNSAELQAPDGTLFNIEKYGQLYFLNNVSHFKNRSHTLAEWHNILGHCNVKDVLKLESVVEGMKITNKNNFVCDTCVMGKMSQYRCRDADKKATCQLALVHCDLSGPIDPIGRDGFRYSMCFVDDYSGLIMIYLLKSKSDAILAAEKFLADIAPYGVVKCMRTDNGTEFTCSNFRSLLVKKSHKA